MNLADPDLELIDPTPNVHLLFVHFDKLFFWTKLASRAVVRWSKRMYSCAGICSYDKGGLCDIALSEPLLKLRPRKDLIETLLHEMIHAFLFITNRDRDRDGHGPNFQAHMHRINKCASLNISIYHDFHEEVKLYQTHWWRCNGPCQTRKPYFGVVRRCANRAPGPSDYWWERHRIDCGGTFVKIKEPENREQKKKPKKSIKPNADITKYINNKSNNKKKIDDSVKPILKDSNNVCIKTINTFKNINTSVVSTKKNKAFNPQPVKIPDVFSGSGKILSPNKTSLNLSVAETVRNVWAYKQVATSNNEKVNSNKIQTSVNLNKTKSETKIDSPPSKIMKIDDYFKSNARTLLKDLYGKDFDIKEMKTNKEKRLSVVPVVLDLVDCPICNTKVDRTNINRHLDECLNKDVIEKLSKEVTPITAVKTETITQTNIASNSKSPISISAQNVVSSDFYINGNPIYEKVENNSDIDTPKRTLIKVEPSVGKESKVACPCCGNNVDKTIEEHLDECLAFFDDTNTPEEGSSKLSNEIITISDDEFDETPTLNTTGTKYPCPCCMKMVEETEMNSHLDVCLK